MRLKDAITKNLFLYSQIIPYPAILLQVLAYGGQQPTQTLQAVVIASSQQPQNTVSHDVLRQHLQLEQLSDKSTTYIYEVDTKFGVSESFRQG